MLKTKIKAVVLDLDGTLLNSQGYISNQNRKCLEKIYRKKVLIFIATGRGRDAFRFIGDIPCDAIILNNGMQVFYNNCIVQNNRLELNFLNDFINEIKKSGLRIGVCERTVNFFNEQQDIDNEKYIYDFFPKQFDKMFIEIKSYSDAKLVEKKLPPQYYITFSKDGYGFVLPNGISKLSGIKILLEIFSIQMEQVVAFGDDLNDLEMIKKCGIGVAMKNALEEVKNVADVVTKTNDQNGVACILECLCKDII